MKRGSIKKRLLSLILITGLLLGMCTGCGTEVSASGNETDPVDETDAAVEDYGPDIFAETYCVIDGDTGDVIISCLKDQKMYPASTTKILTALLVFENVKNLNSVLTFTETSVNVDPSSSTLQPKAQAGEKMTVLDALHGMMLSSANECAAMLGEYVAGSEEAFAQMMNKKAEEIGASDSHFVNAYGIHDDDHYTTAYDLCLIMQAAMENEDFRELMEDRTYTIKKTNMAEARMLENTHALMNGTIEVDGVIGGKTGSTPQAGRCLVTAVERNGLYTISALMKSDYPDMYEDAQVLIEFAYGLSDGTIPEVEFTFCDDIVTPTEAVRIRYSPSVRGGIAGTLNMGETLHRTGVYNGWSRVEYNDGVCYVSSQYLTSVSGDAPEESAETESKDSETEATETEETETTEITETSSDTESESAPDVTTGETASEENKKAGTADLIEEFALTYLWKILLAAAAVLAAVLIAVFTTVHRRHRKLKKRLQQVEEQKRAYRTRSGKKHETGQLRNIGDDFMDPDEKKE